jgi:hypothetical protein
MDLSAKAVNLLDGVVGLRRMMVDASPLVAGSTLPSPPPCSAAAITASLASLFLALILDSFFTTGIAASAGASSVAAADAATAGLRLPLSGAGAADAEEEADAEGEEEEEEEEEAKRTWGHNPATGERDGKRDTPTPRSRDAKRSM